MICPSFYGCKMIQTDSCKAEDSSVQEVLDTKNLYIVKARMNIRDRYPSLHEIYGSFLKYNLQT